MTPTSGPIDTRQVRPRRRRQFDAPDAVADQPLGEEAVAAGGLAGMRRLMRAGDDAARARLLTGLQRTHGNRAVQRLVGRTGAPTLVQRRDPPNAGGPPNASVSPPNASVGSRAPVIHEGIALQPDMNALRPILERLIAERGAHEMSLWAKRFIEMTPAEEGKRYLFVPQPVDPAFLADIKVHLKEALLKLEYDNKEFLKTFEEKALAATKEALNHSEEQIKKEQQRLGLAGSQDANKEGVPQTVYSMSNAQAGKAIQDAAREMAAKRKQLDTAREEMVKAKKALSRSQKVPDTFA